jgi:Spy/CpxP family protein refolding chaperone
MNGTRAGLGWRLWLGLVIVAVCGAAVGVAAVRAYDIARPHKERGLMTMKPRVLRSLETELKLTDVQRRTVEVAVGQAEVELLTLRMEQQPKVEEAMQRAMASMKTVLTAEQQVKLDEMYGRLERRWEREREYVLNLQPKP